ncbi:unnamed protein product [Chondrus crispus]|uniref:Uncharacterized protein n=1 Tax=Chondrus crispus TaxID=2769 RepID=R7QHG1_CHOCR|nr:unnamed protein product [Chondrus crispus]CDF37479.1 unnamed protein product [Chondrus crispus]|eukprot:XP_005717298.1 unnamed protein product [Chondrus crispus]
MAEQSAPPIFHRLALHTHSQAAPTAAVHISRFPPASFAHKLNPVPCASLARTVESKSQHYFHHKTVHSVAQPASSKPLHPLHPHLPVPFPPSRFLFFASSRYSIPSQLPRIAKPRLSVALSSPIAHSKIVSPAPLHTHPLSEHDKCSRKHTPPVRSCPLRLGSHSFQATLLLPCIHPPSSYTTLLHPPSSSLLAPRNRASDHAPATHHNPSYTALLLIQPFPSALHTIPSTRRPAPTNLQPNSKVSSLASS